MTKIRESFKKTHFVFSAGFWHLSKNFDDSTKKASNPQFGWHLRSCSVLFSFLSGFCGKSCPVSVCCPDSVIWFGDLIRNFNYQAGRGKLSALLTEKVPTSWLFASSTLVVESYRTVRLSLFVTTVLFCLTHLILLKSNDFIFQCVRYIQSCSKY